MSDGAGGLEQAGEADRDGSGVTSGGGVGSENQRHQGPEFGVALQGARRPTMLEDPFADAVDEASSQAPRRGRAAKDRTCLAQVAIGAHTVICLNTERKIVMLLDRASMAFISDYMVTLTRNVIHSMSKNCPTPEPSSSTNATREVAPFHFVASPTPCIRDKVVWSAGRNVWQVLPKGKEGKKKKVAPLAVDASLTGKKFDDEKTRQYRAAVELWNAEDESKRIRIPTLRLDMASA